MIHEIRVLGVCVEWTPSLREAEVAFAKTRQSAEWFTRNGDAVKLVKRTRAKTASLSDQLRAKWFTRNGDAVKLVKRTRAKTARRPVAR